MGVDILQDIQEAIRNIQDVSQTRQDDSYHPQEFGENWFRWEDWQIDQAFMESLYGIMKRWMMEEDGKSTDTSLNIPGLNPIIQLLYRKKEDLSYGNLDIDKMIRFFTVVGIKYWYAVNACHYEPCEAINSLKMNASMTNSEYIEFLKHNPARN